MWSRKRIDIGWRDLAAAAGYMLVPVSRAAAERAAEQTWPGGEDGIACLSVRSGFDLMLGQLAWPAGTEVLISAVTIADMATILRHHDLVPVPIDVDPSDMAPRLDEIEKAITPRTKAMLVAHLFGTRISLAPFADKARQHGLLLWEDCAQAFDGRYTGHPAADAVMFSFGPIKTATALGGGVLRVRDRELLKRMRSVHATWPLSRRRAFLSRMMRYAMLKALSGRLACAAVLSVLTWLGRDPDRVLNGAVRNFPGAELLAQLRRRPSAAMLRLLARRLRTFRADRIERQGRLGRRMAERLMSVAECPGVAAAEHSHWVFPICVPDAAPVLAAVRVAGFDASAASQMRAVADSSGSLHTTPDAARITKEAVFLPLYPEMTEAAIDRLTDTLTTLLPHENQRIR